MKHERILLRTLPKNEIAYWELQGQVEYFNFNGHPKGEARIKGILHRLNEPCGFYERVEERK